MRLLWVLLSSLVCAASAWLAALAICFYANPRLDEIQTRLAGLALAADARAARQLLSFSCERDVEIERLLLELAAGATETGAARVAERLTRALSGQVSLFVEQHGALDSLVAGPAAELSLLRRAKQVRVAANESMETTLFDACTRRHGPRTLWLLHATKLSAVLDAAGLVAAHYRTTRATDAVAHVDARASAREQSKADPWRLESFEGAPLSLQAMPEEDAEQGNLPTVLLVCSLTGGVLGALLGFLLTRRRTLDESVLATLEKAAERVAQGDLSSQIGVRFGGRADQTVRSFDRMTVELREMRLKLAEAERAAAWQDMAQRIAHEIKNPLSPIRIGLETLRKAHDKRLPAFEEIFAESTHAMLEEVQRMERIVREFSEFARLPKARPGAMTLGALVQETARLYTPDDVALEVVVPEAERLIHADREQLTQVLVNLLGNAVHAARLSQAPRLRVRVEQTAEQTLLSVEDNGPGVAREERERIFEPYVTNKQEGTGLGLAIARRIVSDHGGTIGVDESALGGARFSLRLPHDRQP